MISRDESFHCNGIQNIFWLSRPPVGYVEIRVSSGARTFTRSGRKIVIHRAPAAEVIITAFYEFNETFAWYELNQEEKLAIGGWREGARLRVMWATNLYEFMQRPFANWEEWQVASATELNRRLNSIGLPPLGPTQENLVPPEQYTTEQHHQRMMAGLETALVELDSTTACAAQAISAMGSAVDGLHTTTNVLTTTTNAVGNVTHWYCNTCSLLFSNAAQFEMHNRLTHLDFTCPVCFAKFQNQDERSEHFDEHSQAQIQAALKEMLKPIPTPEKVKAKKARQKTDRSNIIADGFEPDEELEIDI